MSLHAIRSGAAEIAVESAGQGPPVVLLHAGVADRRMWRAEVAALASAGFRANAYDRRGFGDTLHAEEPWSHADDLVAVLDEVARDRPAILVGCSMGGALAIDTALAQPRRVLGLVLVAPAISGAPEPTLIPPGIQALVDRMERAEAASDVDAINALEAHAWLDGPQVPEGRVGGAARELFFAMNDIALRSEVRGTLVQPLPAYGRLGDITCPTLVTWGDLDFPDVIDNCRHVADAIANARRHVFTGAAHLPNLEQPAAFDRLLVEFCRSVTSGIETDGR
ncbi:MAG TPA: alpha/beta hydrolase [Casimicrobiaceae bacterium]